MNSQWENIVKNNTINSNFSIVTTLDSLKKEKGQSYLDQWLYWEPSFKEIQVPIWIFTLDSSSTACKVQKFYDTQIHFISVKEKTMRHLHCVREKFIFGKTRTVIDPAIFLYYKNECVYKAIRTNNKTIGEAYLKAVDIQYKFFVTNFRKRLTTKKEFASI